MDVDLKLYKQSLLLLLGTIIFSLGIILLKFGNPFGLSNLMVPFGFFLIIVYIALYVIKKIE